jgi:hypothetical protein
MRLWRVKAVAERGNARAVEHQPEAIQGDETMGLKLGTSSCLLMAV